MRDSSPDSIKKEILDIYHAIKDLKDDEILHGPPSRPQDFYDRLSRLAAMKIEDNVVEEILHDPVFKQAIMEICRLRLLYGLRLEIVRAQSILAGPDPWDVLEGFLLHPNYVQLARMEYGSADLKKGDRVIFLGSGPLPLSLILLCAQHGVEGIGIEQVPEYVNLSQKVIASLKLKGLVHIVQGNHFAFPLEQNFKLIMVASAAHPKEEIFGHLASVLPVETKISCRIYEKGLRRILDDQSSFRVPPGFREYLRIRPEPPVNNTVVFLRKASSTEAL